MSLCKSTTSDLPFLSSDLSVLVGGVLPAIGGPRAEDTPLANVNNPKALVNFSNPRRSHMIIDVREMYAAEKGHLIMKQKVLTRNIISLE